jgi:hippurate hydrolase
MGWSFGVLVRPFTHRNLSLTPPIVISVTRFAAGSEAYNVIPSTATLSGTLRCFSRDIRAELPDKMCELVSQMASGLGCSATCTWHALGFPPTVNHFEPSKRALEAAKKTVGESNVSLYARELRVRESL